MTEDRENEDIAPRTIFVCDGCGCPTWSKDWPEKGHLSCCPERSPKPRLIYDDNSPAEPSITLRELKALVEGMKRKLPTGNEIELGIADNSAYTHNAALTDLYEAAEKGRG